MSEPSSDAPHAARAGHGDEFSAGKRTSAGPVARSTSGTLSTSPDYPILSAGAAAVGYPHETGKEVSLPRPPRVKAQLDALRHAASQAFISGDHKSAHYLRELLLSLQREEGGAEGEGGGK